MKKFNSEYFNLWKEIPLFILLWIHSLWIKEKIQNKKILIVVPCLIGEFVAAIPAIRDFIERYKEESVDLLVTPQLRDLAEKIHGVHEVFTVSSLYGRKEGTEGTDKLLESYEKVIVLRMSPAAYAMLKKVRASQVETHTLDFIQYALHLLWGLIVGETPKRWRTFNFEMLGGEDRKIPFENLFGFDDEDYKNIALHIPSGNDAKKIIIHTSANWPSKNWDRGKWVALLEKINASGNFQFIFVGADEDVETYEYIQSKIPFTVHSLIHKTRLVELPILFHNADYFIGIDSGPSNLAHLVGLPSITMIGVSPNMYLSRNENDITLDKTGNRGIAHMFFSVKNSPMSKVQADDVYKSFLKLMGNIE